FEPASPVADGTTALLLHGFPSSTYTFHDLAPALAERGFNTIAVDLPGFGLSERPQAPDFNGGFDPYTPEAQVRLVAALLEALDVESAVVIGNASGARLALDLALADPELIEGLVLIGGTL